MSNNQSGGSGGEEKKKNQGVSEMILGSMKTRSGKETSKWINNLTSEGVREIEDAAKTYAAQTALPAQFAHPSIAQTQVKWVDRLFDILQQYESEFNRACQIADLRVVTERAVITADLIARLQSNDQYHYSGRMHTRFWTLAITGNLSFIEAYLIPSDHYIGFENNISDYTKLFEFIPMWDGELKWSFEKGSISFAQLPSMAKLIFGHLINVAKGDSDSVAPFSYGLSSPPPSSQPVVAPAWQASASGQSNDSKPSDYLMNHGGVFDEDKPILAAEAGKDEASNNKQDLESPLAAKSETSFASTSLADVTITQACEILEKAIGRDLELLSKAGAKAFEDHDFVEVEKLMKRTTKLKSMKEKMLATITEWKRMLAED